MSQIPPTATTSSTNFETIFTAALEAYKKKTKKDITSHPLATQLQSCDSSTAILTVLQAQVQINDQAQSADEKWTKWLDPTVNVVSAFSAVLNVAGPVITTPYVAQVLPSDASDHRYSHLRQRSLPESAFFSK
jgi:ABC-type phosphate transport system substrate-binding protein